MRHQGGYSFFRALQGSGNRSFSLQWSSAGAVVMYDGVNTTSLVSAAGVLSLNTQYVVSAVATVGSTTSSDIYIRIYAVGGSTPIASVHVTNANTTANPMIGFDLGDTNPVAVVGYSNVQFDNGATSEIPDYVPANTAPTLDVGTNQSVAPGATVNLSAIASDADGDSITYNWSVVYSSTTSPTLQNATSATPSFVATSVEGNLYILQCTVTDSRGASTIGTVEVQIPISGSFTVLPINGSDNSWATVGGSATSGAALSDSNDATLVRSPSYTATESETRIRLQPLKPRSSLQFTVRSLVSSTGGVTKVRLYAGNILKQEWVLTQSTSASDQTLTVNAGNLPVTGQWGNLYIAPVVSA